MLDDSLPHNCALTSFTLSCCGGQGLLMVPDEPGLDAVVMERHALACDIPHALGFDLIGPGVDLGPADACGDPLS
jgi:hypothetical protein